MNALPAAHLALPIAPPSSAASDSAQADERFGEHLASAAQALDHPASSGPARPGDAPAGPRADTEAEDENPPATDPAPDLPWLSQWAGYAAQPASSAPAPAAANAAAGAGADALSAIGAGVPGDGIAPGAADAAAPAGRVPVANGGPAPSASPSLPDLAAGVAAPSSAAAAATRPNGAGVADLRPDVPAKPAGRAATTDALPQPAAQESARSETAFRHGVLQESATVPVTAGASHHTPGPALRSEAPTVPGAPVPLHAGALQDRIDTALRWMAGGGLQTAQIRVDPDALGPITVHLRLDGDVASVVFGSNHEQTRQALENSLAGLKEALSAGGLNLGQASVGSEQQSGFLAARQFGGRDSAPQGNRGQAADDHGAKAASPVPPTRGATSAGAGNRMVDLYA